MKELEELIREYGTANYMAGRVSERKSDEPNRQLVTWEREVERRLRNIKAVLDAMS